MKTKADELNEKVLGVPIWMHLVFFPFPVVIVGEIALAMFVIQFIRNVLL